MIDYQPPPLNWFIMALFILIWIFLLLCSHFSHNNVKNDVCAELNDKQYIDFFYRCECKDSQPFWAWWYRRRRRSDPKNIKFVDVKLMAHRCFSSSFILFFFSHCRCSYITSRLHSCWRIIVRESGRWSGGNGWSWDSCFQAISEK